MWLTLKLGLPKSPSEVLVLPLYRTARRAAAVLAPALALLVTLTACGGGADSSSESTDDPGAGFPRTVKHHKGKAELDHKPKRIVALDPSLVETVVALDRPVVGGVSSYVGQQGFPKYLGDAVKKTEDVGPLESPDLEAITALKPDLIVSASIRHDAIYDELKAIAPTVFVETTGPTWKANVRKTADALGAEKKADQVIGDYEKRAAALGKAINKKAGDPTFSVVRFLDGPTRLYARESFIGIILKDMEIARPKPQDVDEFAVEIGEEQIRKADGDYIFVTTYEGGEPAEERFKRNPLWKELDGVKAGNVHDVRDDTWMMSVSPQGAHLAMDEMAKIFDVDPARS
ncbi:MAG: ABC transporter substrate-binding protein [Streptosporangiales bacterium]|nr:ABC transporter substrate-binding protein [Streptosporangiales bacterium]